MRDEARKGLEEVDRIAEAITALEAELETATPEAAEAMMERYGELQERFEALDGFAANARAEEVLSGLGFEISDFDRDCGELSGGWQMRVALARLLLQRPDLLLLDEPTNHLDLASVVWLENFLATFPGTLVFISHDRWFLDRLCSHIAELAGGVVTLYTGNFTKYLAQAEERRSLLERQARNQERRIAELERFITRFRAKATKARQAQSRQKMLDKIERIELDREERTIRFEIPPPPKSGRVVLELEDVEQAYGERVIWSRLQLELVRGRRIALVGPNGAGKSTLLKLLAGVIPHRRGDRRLGFQAQLYYFAQHQIDVLDLKLRVLDEAVEAAGHMSPTKVRGVLGAFLFGEDDVEKKVGVLSGGEKNRLALVKMLLTPANVLLLDEPTNHLDMASRAVLEEALMNYSGTLVIISHDRHFIDAVCNEVWEVDQGRITPFHGGYTDYETKAAKGQRPDPLPLYQPERVKRQRPPQAPKKKKAPSPKPAPAPEPDRGIAGDPKVRRRKSRDEKRVEAQARNKRSSGTRALRLRVAAAEANVERLESELAALRSEQADPAHYQDTERVKTVARLSGELQAEVAAAYSSWEALSAELESAEA